MALKIKPWHDYHGDAVVFQVVDERGDEWGRFVSEAEAIKQLPIIEENRKEEKKEYDSKYRHNRGG